MGRRKFKGKPPAVSSATPAVIDWSLRGPAPGEPHWRIIPNAPDLLYYPNGPEGEFFTLTGWCRPEGTHRYEHTEQDICGREIVVIVQCRVDKYTNGVRVWYPDSRHVTWTWYWQSSHFKNTLLADPTFDALITPLLTFDLPGCDDRGRPLSAAVEDTP